MTARSRRFLAWEFRALIEIWRVRKCWKPPESENWNRTCTIITSKPNEFVREIHTRMPVILPEDEFDAWLSGEAGKEILVPRTK
jgi:putative SOS response-associated peptidase YedK